MRHMRFCPQHQTALPRSCDHSQHPRCVWGLFLFGGAAKLFKNTYMPHQLLNLVSKRSYVTLKLAFRGLPEL